MAKIHWASAKSGAFETGANWTGSAVPGAGDDAIIDASGAAYTVTTTADESILGVTTLKAATLTIGANTKFTATNGTDGGGNFGTIAVANGAIFEIGTDSQASEFSNSGKVTLNATANPTLLGIFGDVTLDGGGSVVLSDNSNNNIGAAGSSGTSTITIGGTPHPDDTISLTFTNSSLSGFPATVTYKVGLTDTTTIIAAQLADLIAANTSLKAAHISAAPSGANITITEDGAASANTVISDKLSTGATESIDFSPNDGTLAPSSPVSYSLTNVDNTISGAGTIGDAVDDNLTFTNAASGVVSATGTHALIIDTGNTVTNFGILQDTGKGGLLIKDTVDNIAVIQAIGAGAHVDLSGGTIVGGELYTQGGGQIDTVAATVGTLDGSAGQVTNLGTFVVVDNSKLVVDGDIDNAGVIKLTSAGKVNVTAAVQLGADTNLSGGGQIILSDATTNIISGDGGVRILTNNDNTISGAGTIGDTQMELDNESGGTINATGKNALVISASGSSTNLGLMESTGIGTLSLTTDLDNEGVIAATGKAAIIINGPTISNGTDGVVIASGAGSHIDVGSATLGGESATIDGGTVATVFGAKIDTVATKLSNPANALTISNATVSNAGTIAVADNTSLTLDTDEVKNTGSITVSGATVDTQIIIGGSTTLNGGGKLILTDNAFNSIVANGSAATLDNLDNIISGAGTIGDADLTLTNEIGGIINATGAKTVTEFATASGNLTNDGLIETTGAAGLTFDNDFTNNGTLLASGTGALTISGTVSGTGVVDAVGKVVVSGTIDTAALVEATGKGTIQVEGGTISGDSIVVTGAGAHIDLDAGTLNATAVATNSGGKIDTIAGTTNNVINSSVSNAGSIVVTDQSTLSLDSLIVNTGLFSIAGVKGTTTLEISGGATFSGGGLITLTDSLTNIVSSDGAGATLENFDNTISGAGELGDGDDNLTIQNDVGGLINANGKNALILDTGTTAIVNSGIIETTNTGGATLLSEIDNTGFLIAKGTGGLAVDGLVNNLGGVIEAVAANSHIDLGDGAEIDNGTVSTVIGSKINLATGAKATLAADTLINAGSIVIANAAVLTVAGEIHNSGSVAINGSSATSTALTLDGDASLLGSGSIILSDNAKNVINASSGSTLSNFGNTISGAGTIGNDGSNLILFNEGTINANAKTNGLLIDTGTHAITNGGLIELTGTGPLTIDSDVTNTLGTILANSKTATLTIGDGSGTTTITDGTVQLAAAGGALVLNEGTIDNAAVSVIAGATIKTAAATTTNAISGLSFTNAGTVSITNNSTLLIDGPVTNTGTIGINSSSAAATNLETDFVLSLFGHGKLTLTNNVNNHVQSDQASGDVTLGTETAQIGGSFANGDTVSLTFTNSDNSVLPETVTYTMTGTDNADSVAAALTLLINTDAKLAASDISASVSSDTITISEPGLESASTKITGAGSGSETVTLSGVGGFITGGTGDASVLDNVDNTISGAGVFGSGDETFVVFNEVNGVINANGSQLLKIDTNHETVVNFGLIETTGAGGLKVDGDLANFGKLVANAGVLEIDGSLTGTGTATIGQNGTLDIVEASHQNISFASTLGGKLQLGDSKEFSGNITGFGGSNTDSIDLQDLTFHAGTTATFTATDATHGVLTVANGVDPVVTLNLVGDYSAATFTAADDGPGHGVLIHDPPAPHIVHHHGDHLV